MYSNNVYKGRYRVVNPGKYAGDHTKVIFRSMWEYKFMKYCDHNPSILEWGSEEIVIPYLSPVDGKIHRYFVDFYCRIQESNGRTQRYLIEIKPSKFTRPPDQPQRRTPRYLQEVFTWGVNQAKWQAARDFCENRGWRFEILTEHELGLDK